MTADFPNNPAYRRELTPFLGNLRLALKVLKRDEECFHLRGRCS